MITGKILWIDHRDGNGIVRNEQGFEYYFDTSSCPEFDNLKRDGAIVTFEENIIEHCPCRCAKNVALFQK